eukprot:8284348-Alexandrium_andersonii.AAC.1
MEWAFAKACSLGVTASVVILGDWSNEPAETPLARWALVDGWGLLAPTRPTRWQGRRVIDWGAFKAHGVEARTVLSART